MDQRDRSTATHGVGREEAQHADLLFALAQVKQEGQQEGPGAATLLDPRTQQLSVADGGVAKRKARSGPRSRTSPYIGVSQVRSGKYKRTGRWEAHIWDSSDGDKGRQLHLGSFLTARQAAKAYDRAAIIMRGKAAELNFSMDEYATDPALKELRALPKRAMVVAIRKLQDDPEEQEAMAAEQAAAALLQSAAAAPRVMMDDAAQEPGEVQPQAAPAIKIEQQQQQQQQQQAAQQVQQASSSLQAACLPAAPHTAAPQPAAVTAAAAAPPLPPAPNNPVAAQPVMPAAPHHHLDSPLLTRQQAAHAGPTPWKYGYSWLGVKVSPPAALPHVAVAAHQASLADSSLTADSPTLVIMSTNRSPPVTPLGDPMGSGRSCGLPLTSAATTTSTTTMAATATPIITHLALPTPNAPPGLDPRQLSSTAPAAAPLVAPSPGMYPLAAGAALGIPTYLPPYGMCLPAPSPYQQQPCINTMEYFNAGTPTHSTPDWLGLSMSSPCANPRTLLRPTTNGPPLTQRPAPPPVAPFPSLYLNSPTHPVQQLPADPSAYMRTHMCWQGAHKQ